MRKESFLLILAGLALFSVSDKLSAQDSDRVVILSPRVGSTIDSSEREYFQLFRQIKDFHSAVFLENPDSTYYAWIVLKDSNGNTRDTAVWYPKSYLLMVAEKINHFEELTEGRYQMGQNPATLQVFESKEARRLPVAAKPRPEAGPRLVEPEKALAPSRSEGAKVVLQLPRQLELSGELLSVRDSVLVISTLEDASAEDLSNQTAAIIVVRNQYILHAVVKGESKAGKGALIGFAVGGGTGALMGLASGDDPQNTLFSMTAGQKAVLAGSVLGGLGALIGGIAGWIASPSDVYVEPHSDGDLQILKQFARFPDKEPEFLQLIK
jgi:multisubunit Na+/H+ antiporter MnhB subunit